MNNLLRPAGAKARRLGRTTLACPAVRRVQARGPTDRADRGYAHGKKHGAGSGVAREPRCWAATARNLRPKGSLPAPATLTLAEDALHLEPSVVHVPAKELLGNRPPRARRRARALVRHVERAGNCARKAEWRWSASRKPLDEQVGCYERSGGRRTGSRRGGGGNRRCGDARHTDVEAAGGRDCLALLCRQRLER